jgi:BlaI family transcriptional regulator, penicillinase repressor
VARRPAGTLTGREAEIMDAVWRLGEATAEQVREAMAGRPHDSTVRTLLRVLEGKGYLRHEARGKAYVYTAAITRVKAQRAALGDVLARFFGGSAEGLVMRLVEDEHLTPAQLVELRRAAPAPPERGRRKRGGTGR